MTLKKTTVASLGASAVGAASVLAAANNADALNRAWEESTDIVTNLATRSNTGASFSITGTNSAASLTATVVRTTSGATVSVTTPGLSLYTRAYVRCYTSQVGGVYGVAYSGSADQQGEWGNASCSSLPAAIGPWQRLGFGAVVLTHDDSGITKTNRQICDGQGCGAADTLRVKNAFLTYYTNWVSGPTGIAAEAVKGPSNPCTTCFVACW